MNTRLLFLLLVSCFTPLTYGNVAIPPWIIVNGLYRWSTWISIATALLIELVIFKKTFLSFLSWTRVAFITIFINAISGIIGLLYFLFPWSTYFPALLALSPLSLIANILIEGVALMFMFPRISKKRIFIWLSIANVLSNAAMLVIAFINVLMVRIFGLRIIHDSVLLRLIYRMFE